MILDCKEMRRQEEKKWRVLEAQQNKLQGQEPFRREREKKYELAGLGSLTQCCKSDIVFLKCHSLGHVHIQVETWVTWMNPAVMNLCDVYISLPD